MIIIDSRKRNSIIAGVIFLVMALVLTVSYYGFPPLEDSAEKVITVEITHLDGKVSAYEIKTTEPYLRGALDQENLVSGPTMEYGLWVQTIDGETADGTKEQWWGYTKAGQYVGTGVDSTPITDGDVFEFTLNVGW